MSEPLKPAGGLFASLRRLLVTALEMAQVRLDLFLTEFQQEKLRVFDSLLWAGVALMLIGVGVILLCGFVVILLWETHRLATLGVLTLLFLGSGALLMRAARNRLRSPAGALSATMEELQRDMAELGQHKG